jgi:catechol 2,3-dioxygenase-like lactoylglutathione lyase family enzyme
LAMASMTPTMPVHMNRVSRRGVVAAAVSGLLMAAGARLAGQTTPAAVPSGKGAVIGTGSFTSFVENMDRSLAFYHDAFGMEVPPIPASGERPYNAANPRLFAMFDIAGARERHQSARVPGTGVTIELMEIQNVDSTTVALRTQDPGAATLVLGVRDIDAALSRAKSAQAVVVTPGGKPVTLTDGTRAILIRDRDSRPIELRQQGTMQAGTDPAANNVTDMRLSIAVADLEKTTRMYRDVLGFIVEDETALRADAPTGALTGLTAVTLRRNRVKAPGATMWIEFVEYSGVDRVPLRMRIQDRGAARLQVRAQNVDDLVEAMKTAGFRVASLGGGAVPIPPNFKGALVADPNNFFLTPFAPCDGCAPFEARPSR